MEKLQERIGLDCFNSVITSIRQAESQLMLAKPASQVVTSLHSDNSSISQ